MREVDTGFTGYLKETFEVMNDLGLLLVSGDMDKPNVMAIGWGTAGITWGKPLFVVLVRPSRYTYGLIEKSGEFTVNVPFPEMEEVVSLARYPAEIMINSGKRILLLYREKKLNVPLSGNVLSAMNVGWFIKMMLSRQICSRTSHPSSILKGTTIEFTLVRFWQPIRALALLTENLTGLRL
jgi:hypothetical protein